MGSESRNDSRIKKGKSKKPMVFAKDKKQARLALIVAIAFIANSIYMIVKYVQAQNPAVQPQTAQTSPASEDPSSKTLDNLSATNLNPSAVNSSNQNLQQDANNIYSQTVNLQNNNPNQNLNAPQTSEETVEILPKKTIANKSGKMVEITVTNSERQNPFLPSSEGLDSSLAYLLPPPETLPVNTEASKIISTKISGILYDKYNPSAIINIEGTDYLVKQGDVINNYRVLSIGKSQVIVQLGKNIYKAGVGELLSQSTFNSNIANLNKKFGGNYVSINVKRKGY